MFKSKYPNFFQRAINHPQNFNFKYDPLECIEELNTPFDPNPIEGIRKHQSQHNEYEYENDIKTWIK